MDKRREITIGDIVDAKSKYGGTEVYRSPVIGLSPLLWTRSAYWVISPEGKAYWFAEDEVTRVL